MLEVRKQSDRRNGQGLVEELSPLLLLDTEVPQHQSQRRGIGETYLPSLHILQPGARTLAMLPTLAARTWDVRKESIAADAKSLVRLLDEQNTLNQRAIKARLMGELSEEDFKSFKTSTETETKRIQEQITALDSERSTMEELVKQADAGIIDLGES
jgi:tRNA A22 N-methylase